jgi:hypothetical protein
LVVRSKVSDKQRLRWETDGISVPLFGDESVQVGASGPSRDCCPVFKYSNRLLFTGVTGDLNTNPWKWLMNIGSSGGIVSQSYVSTMTNFTDSFFDFDGIIATIGHFLGASPQSYTVDRVSIFFTSGIF